MFKSIIQYILTNIFKISTQTTTKEINDNSKYANIYEQIDNIRCCYEQYPDANKNCFLSIYRCKWRGNNG